MKSNSTSETQPSAIAQAAADSIEKFFRFKPGASWIATAEDILTEAESIAALIDKHIAPLLSELAGFKALDAYLPEGYAIGDDATASLAVDLAKAEAEIERLKKQLEGK